MAVSYTIGGMMVFPEFIKARNGSISPSTCRIHPSSWFQLVKVRLNPYFLRVALMSASMWSRYFSKARRPAALSRYSVRGVRPANVFSHST